jgi:glycosyltransferase involved in cell wall biosynthesis
MPMKIAHISPVYPPRGGMGTAAKDLADLAREAGHDVILFTPKYESNPPKGRGVIFLKPFFSFGNAAILFGLIRRLKEFDILHLHYPFYGSDIIIALAAKKYGVPLVVSYHMKTFTRDWRNIIFKFHRIFVEPFIFRTAKKVIVTTIDYGEANGLPQGRIVALPLPVDIDRFHPREDKKGGESLKVLFVGGLDKAHDFKGVDKLIAAISKISEQVKIELRIVGGGSELETFQSLAAALGCKDRVTFLGRVSDEGLPEEYRNADVHILPSINRGEAFGIVTLEAAASGIPSIVSDLPGVRTLVKQDETGFIISPGDVISIVKTLEYCANNKEELRNMGRKARKRIRNNYTQDIIKKQLQELYKGVKLRT